jgi:DNA topoisomerase-1
VSLPKDAKPEEVKLDTALQYLSLPRTLGEDPSSGEEVSVGLGRYGPYVRRGKTFANLATPERMFTVTLAEALDLIQDREKSGGRKVIRELGKHPETGVEIRLLAGRYGPYVTDGNLNATLPKRMDPDEVDLETAVDLLVRKAARGGKGRARSRSRRS